MDVNMANKYYYCHVCQQQVIAHNEEGGCSLCGWNFLEELQTEDPQVLDPMVPLPESTSDETEERTDWEAELVSAGMELADAHFEARQGITADNIWNQPLMGGLLTNDQFDALLANFLEELESEVISIDPELLNNLPMTVIVQTDVDRSTACAICLKSFIPEEKVARLDCSHFFHRSCITRWLQERNRCPLCRQLVDATKWPSIV
uniref:RING-type domain-containing protein n=2 Tax=Ascaris TaxID=6251 RepID=A0A0M3HMU3_ASCLU